MAERTDPFAPDRAHAAQLEEARTRARSDAIRHAEDMLYRKLPIVEEAEMNAARRVALLEERRAELLAEHRETVTAAERRVTSAERRRDAVLAGLAALGVPRDELEVPPLDRPMAARWRVGVPVVLAALAAAIAFVLGVDLLLIGLAAAAAFGVATAIASMADEQPVETPQLAKLRRERVTAEAAVLEAHRIAGAARAEQAALDVRAAALARSERALAEQTVATYVTELVSAIPPGALADRVQLVKQRRPRVDMPVWASAQP